MRLPVDIPAVLKEAADIEGAANTPLSVSVLIDDTAPGDVVGYVRAAFASAAPRTRVTVSYLGEEPAAPAASDDMAVIVAGVSTTVGAHALNVRRAGVPVMVATTLPALVDEIARVEGFAIPEGDVVSPDVLDGSAEVEEPFALDERAAASLGERMGAWIIAACRPKKLAFALAFPFVRRPLSLDAVNATALQNAAVGLVPFIPGADLPIMTLNQAKMLLQIAAAYDQAMSAERIKEIACVVGGAFLFRNVSKTLAGAVPVLGWAVRAAVGYAGTQAMGRAAIEYFHAGGDIVGVASVVQKARDEAALAAAKAAGSPAGKRAAEAAVQLVRDMTGR